MTTKPVKTKKHARQLAAVISVLTAAAVALTGCGGSGSVKAENGGASIAGSMAAAAAASGEPETMELRYQGWAGTVTLPELAEDLGYLAPVKLKWIGNTISGPQDIQTAATGSVDFGGAFNG